MIDQLAIAGYRSIRSAVLSLGTLNVITGPNGSGKSNVYRALALLADTAEGRLLHSLAHEGGFSSVRWAGPEVITPSMANGDVPIQGTLRKNPVALKLGFTADAFSYCIDVGLPPPSGVSMFSLDPELKRECIWRGSAMTAKNLCADRRKGQLRYRGEGRKWQDIDVDLLTHQSMIAEYSDPAGAPELVILRDILRSWRFYDGFRTDSEAPARRPSVGVFTPVLASDGSDLAAALQTIREIGSPDELADVIDSAFPGSQLVIQRKDVGLHLSLQQPGMLRDLSAAELSDGTLRFLLLVAALLSPRPPELLVLNEPESSLHPDLIPALAKLILLASENGQMIVVSHNRTLVNLLEEDEICVPIRLRKRMGETLLEDANLITQLGWKWPPR